MNITLNKNSIASLILAITVGAIIFRITPVHVTKNITVIISKNRVSITDIHQKRDIISTRKVSLDHVDLYYKGKFGHPKLGNIAKASDDFFLDIDQTFKVMQDGTYEFLVGSDDGFTLVINGKKICEHTHDRPYSIQSCNIFLKGGSHRLQASYFQGFGNSGFTLQYQTNGKTYWFGDDSPNLRLD